MSEGIPAACRDLVEVAAAVYADDIALPRGRNEAWVRDVELVMPVRELDLWRAEQALVTRLVYELTGDNLAFRFTHLPGNDPVKPNTRLGRADCVSLLSGGLDSFAGATTLLRAGRRPILVSHTAGSPTIEAAQRRVGGLLQGVFGDALRHITCFVGPSRVAAPAMPLPDLESREPSQRSRSLLFLALATAAAAASGAEAIYIFENGILAASLPLSRARVGGLRTRTAHPEVLALFSRLAETTLGRRVALLNPFARLTKAEVIEQALRPRFRIDDIQAADSCWQGTRAARACGGCMPCLVRRISMLAAGLPDEVYQLDLLSDPSAHTDTDALANLSDLVTCTTRFRVLAEQDLLMTYPELLEAAAHGLGPEAVVGVYRRFGEEIERVLRDHFPAAAALLGEEV